jgi:hypothetical protein
MTIRQYKKKYFICKDDFGKVIYLGDTVEVWMPCEAKPYQSCVYWNRLDGAFIDGHPGHVKMGHSKHRSLNQFFMRNNPPVPIYDSFDDDAVPTWYQGYVKKVKSFYEGED